MLSCSCYIDNPEWWYYAAEDFTILQTNRRKRCCSCSKLIDIGSSCVELKRARHALTEVEEDICGYEVPLASWWLCEWCGEMYLNLSELGYCYYAGDDLREDLKEYWEMTGFDPTEPKTNPDPS
jgi:hypothetical protein